MAYIVTPLFVQRGDIMKIETPVYEPYEVIKEKYKGKAVLLTQAKGDGPLPEGGVVLIVAPYVADVMGLEKVYGIDTDEDIHGRVMYDSFKDTSGFYGVIDSVTYEG